MRVRLHGLRVVDGIASRVERRSIGEVPNGIHKLRARKWGSSDVLVRGNRLRVVDSVARFVKRGSVRQVADIVGKPERIVISLEPQGSESITITIITGIFILRIVMNIIILGKLMSSKAYKYCLLRTAAPDPYLGQNPMGPTMPL